MDGHAKSPVGLAPGRGGRYCGSCRVNVCGCQSYVLQGDAFYTVGTAGARQVLRQGRRLALISYRGRWYCTINSSGYPHLRSRTEGCWITSATGERLRCEQRAGYLTLTGFYAFTTSLSAAAVALMCTHRIARWREVRYERSRSTSVALSQRERRSPGKLTSQ